MHGLPAVAVGRRSSLPGAPRLPPFPPSPRALRAGRLAPAAALARPGEWSRAPGPPERRGLAAPLPLGSGPGHPDLAVAARSWSPARPVGALARAVSTGATGPVRGSPCHRSCGSGARAEVGWISAPARRALWGSGQVWRQGRGAWRARWCRRSGSRASRRAVCAYGFGVVDAARVRACLAEASERGNEADGSRRPCRVVSLSRSVSARREGRGGAAGKAGRAAGRAGHW